MVVGPKIPIVDLSQFSSSLPRATRLEAANALISACRDIGFVYLTNHSIPPSVLETAFAQSKHFFSLPHATKMECPHPSGWTIHRGYSWPGLEKVSDAISTASIPNPEAVRQLRELEDVKESFEIGSDDNKEQPNIWPPEDTIPGWKDSMTEFYWHCFDAAKTVLRALALGMGLEDEEMLLRFHSGHYNQLRLLHYPPVCRAEVEEGKVGRMPAHTDWSTITLLFQDECGGLQVEDPKRDGEFVDVPPVEGGMLMNIGDLMMRWSNDYLRSTRHRVVLPSLGVSGQGVEEGGMTRARYSIPYFLTTDPDEVIRCLRVGEGETEKYESITQREYGAMKAKMQY